MFPAILDLWRQMTDNLRPEDLGNPKRGGGGMSKELQALVDRLRGYRMSPEELREQAIDFANGNGHFEDSRVTLEGVTRAADLDSQDEKNSPAQ
jgi:hypothetical protein